MSFNLTLIAQMLAFAAFILFTVKVVWPPLLRVIDQRRKIDREATEQIMSGD